MTAADQATVVSVVIPTLDEEGAIEACIAAAAGPPAVEIIVSDGGSSDDTVTKAVGAGAHVVSGTPGRGPQLNRGAAAASGSVLLFVHADCRLPAGWLGAVRSAVENPRTALCCFRLHTEPVAGINAGRWSTAWLRLVDLRSQGMALPYGDQGFAVRRETFDLVGGFPEIPLMEDLEFARRCRRIGTIRRIPLSMRTTGRRFERHPVRTRIMTASFPLLYRCGVSPHTLARWYGAVR